MQLLEDTLKNIRQQRRSRPSLMTHVVLGYPTLKESMQLVETMAKSGASLIELQIPFSDPIADGPTIMAANEHALRNGVTPLDCLEAMEKLSKRVQVPLLFMSYFNLLFNYRNGVQDFCHDARLAGAEGLIIPDIPPEEKQEGYFEATKAHNLAPIPIVTPITPQKRLEKLSSLTPSSGFVYCVTVTGTTGARTTLPKDLKQYLNRIRRTFSVPLALGFGISTPAHVKAIGKHADIAVLGSAVIDIVQNSKQKTCLSKVSKFISTL